MAPLDLSTKQINFTISVRQLKEIDELAIRDYCTRSDIIRVALTEYMRKPANASQPSKTPGSDPALEQVLRDFEAQQSA